LADWTEPEKNENGITDGPTSSFTRKKFVEAVGHEHMRDYSSARVEMNGGDVLADEVVDDLFQSQDEIARKTRPHVGPVVDFWTPGPPRPVENLRKGGCAGMWAVLATRGGGLGVAEAHPASASAKRGNPPRRGVECPGILALRSSGPLQRKFPGTILLTGAECGCASRDSHTAGDVVSFTTANTP